MPEERTFTMGKIEAKFPLDRSYSTFHLWLRPHDDAPGLYRVGLTEYSIRLLRDVYFLDWSLGPGPVARKQEVGQIESSKAVASLYSPASGTITGFNQLVIEDPSTINADGYNAGWLFDLRTDEALMDCDAYIEHLASTWEETQRNIKKQITST